MAELSVVYKKRLREFIELYKSQPAAWKIGSDLYKNDYEKMESWNILLDKYREIDPDATIKTVKKKINSLRSNYRRELNKIKSSEKTGQYYETTLWYFDLMDFLNDVGQVRKLAIPSNVVLAQIIFLYKLILLIL